MTSSSFLLLVVAASSVTSLQPYEAVEPHMGTLFRIKLYAGSPAAARQAFTDAFTRIAQLDSALSDYQPASELNRLSTAAVHKQVHVSDDLYRVIDAAERLSSETDGAFDITLGPLTHLWREARKKNHVPDTAAIAEAKSHCGYRKLHLDKAARSVELDEAGMQLDVGAIAKGYAADEALKVIGAQGIRSALVAASGDLAFSDAPPEEPGWKIGVDSLDDARAPFTRVMMLANRAVSTSGSSEQHLDASGVRYSHIIDAKTGLGITRDISSTVIARHGIDADSMSTAVNALGVERGLAFIRQHPGTTAVIVTRDSGKLSLFEAKGAGS